MSNRLVLIGNGFDLAHGLKTSYKDFIDWYMCKAFKEFNNKGSYNDKLFNIERKYSGMATTYKQEPQNYAQVNEFISANEYQKLNYSSQFYNRLIDLLGKGWVDIERQYFLRLKSFFSQVALSEEYKEKNISQLNEDFKHIINLLTEYIILININIKECKRLPIDNPTLNFYKAFQADNNAPVTFVNFNYTDTLLELGYAKEEETIYIHGKASDNLRNPIIFGYGDETDSIYQQIEDSGENLYLEHIKSFAYFKTDNYKKLVNLIDSDEYEVYILGHSCGLSDRILLNEIFEHSNCRSIEVFYHQRGDGSDNYTEITQNISRHFRPQNKALMRRRVKPHDIKNIIPQQ